MKNLEVTLTQKELDLLKEIKEYQNEQGHSDFLSTDAASRKNAGIISSLEKKGMIFNSYEDYTKEDWKDIGEKPYKMWCLTTEAANIVGKPKYWW
jgi:hypothetical protein